MGHQLESLLCTPLRFLSEIPFQEEVRVHVLRVGHSYGVASHLRYTITLMVQFDGMGHISRGHV